MNLSKNTKEIYKRKSKEIIICEERTINRRQIIALEGATPGLFNKNMNQAREYVTLKALKLSTVLTVDYMGGSYVWHASIAMVDPFYLMPIAPNKVSKANKVRVQNYLEKMLEGIGGEDFRQSEAFSAFNVFRYLTTDELCQIKNKAA